MLLPIDWQNARIQKISICLHEHSTSFSLEGPFLDILHQEAKRQHISFSCLIEEIDKLRPHNINLSSALRLYSLELAKMRHDLSLSPC